MAEVKYYEDLKSEEVQNTLDDKVKGLIKEIDELKDGDVGNDSLNGVMESEGEDITQKELNKELKNSLMSLDNSILQTIINELNKDSIRDKEGVSDLISMLTDVQYEKSVNDMNDDYEKSVNDMDDDYEKSVNDMDDKYNQSVSSMDSAFLQSTKIGTETPASEPTEVPTSTEEPTDESTAEPTTTSETEPEPTPTPTEPEQEPFSYESGKKLLGEFKDILNGDDYSKFDSSFSNQQLEDLLTYLSQPNNEKEFYDLYSEIEKKTNKLYTSGNVYIMEKFDKVYLDKKEKNERLLGEFKDILNGDDYSKFDSSFSNQQLEDLLTYLSQPNNEKEFYDLYSEIEKKINELYASGNVPIMEMFEKVALDKKERNSEG